MDYDTINSTMTKQQKLSLMAADLQQMIGEEPDTYDDINSHLTEQQKMSLIAAALQTLKNRGGGGEALTINIGSTTYVYDGSEPVTITILDGESMEF